MTGQLIRVLLVDDDAMVRTGLRAILAADPGIEVVAEAAHGAEALERAAAHFPDAVLMDIRMPGMTGIEATRILVNGVRPPKVIALTSFDSEDYVFRALEAGAVGFLLKDTSPQELIAALHTVMSGSAIISPRSTLHLIARFGLRGEHTRRHEALQLIETLTEREREIAVLVAAGASNRNIAEQLFVSEATAKAHLAKVMIKLGADSRVGVAITVERAGLTHANRSAAD
ncbi:response regulator transcription factor [Brevibacterium daeguense]|uniref:Response regulator transcription factor n=1 Tax=Brevibacterium daeguense TaxID=909936 RepID=A0ABP8EJA7_9MICO|nr:response regulator transcription factor [Brevibacterium daeguense]